MIINIITSFDMLPSSFDLSVFNRTFTVRKVREDLFASTDAKEFNGDLISVEFWKNYKGFRICIESFSPEGEYLPERDIYYLFQGIERDETHPSPRMFKPVGVNRHFTNYTGSHCDCRECPVKF